MIDIHSHILPGIDDGSRSIDETMAMLKEAENAGFREIITTPHYFEGYYEADERTREQLINNVKAQMDAHKTSVSLYIGNEIYITEDTMDNVKAKKVSSLNNKKYVLVEFDLNVMPMNMMNMIYKVLKERYIPILAHPERYRFVQQDPSILTELASNGVLFQCNYGSFIGMYGRKAEIIAKKLLKSNMISFLGTDTHRANSVYTRVPEIIKVLIDFVGEAKVDEITDSNQRRVLNNQDIEVNEPKEIKLSLIERMIMNKK
jgi:protein-tyrosine phosphatase